MACYFAIPFDGLLNCFLSLNMALIPKKLKYRLSFRNKIDLSKQRLPMQNALKGSQNIRHAWFDHFSVNPQSSLITHEWEVTKKPAARVNFQNVLFDNQMIDKIAFDQLLFGTSGVCFLQEGTITTKYIETIRLLVARKFKKKSRFWIRLCTDTPVTARPAETRMGKGKGSIAYWEAKVRPGQIFLEFSGIDKQNLISLYNQISEKSGLKMKLLTKHSF